MAPAGGEYRPRMERDAWSPEQYERFAAQRREPFDDLCVLIERAPGMRVVDLGSGTGALTAELHERLGAAETLGIERSPSMLERSRRLERPGLRFVAGDVGELSDEARWDLVFSNAVLHWLPDHPALFRRLARAVAPGGQLAVQMPSNFDHPSHRIAAEVAREEPFASALRGKVREASVLVPEAYAELLDALGFARQHVRLQVYGHRLRGPEEVVEWVRGSTLTAYQSVLPEELFARFLERYRERLLAELPAARSYFYTFKRLLLWARRAAA